MNADDHDDDEKDLLKGGGRQHRAKLRPFLVLVESHLQNSVLLLLVA